MKHIILTLMFQIICLASMSGATPERTLLPASGFALNILNQQDLAVRIEALPSRMSFYTNDPFGNRIEFIRPGDGFSEK